MPLLYLSCLALFIASFCLAEVLLPRFPHKIYGVNLGSWLVLEPWMLPSEWISMGGQQCTDCSRCIATEFSFAKAYPSTVDEKFKDHWESWFSQSDVDDLIRANINTVRIPLGYWIVEPLVNRSSEFYPRGGILQLQRGLTQLKAAGIASILDHHALPGVATPGQTYAGRCTDDVEFYTPYNYHRALIWTAVMTALSHLDPNFALVAAIEAMNEPIMDADKTPGYGEFQVNFVQTVRAVELALGIPVPEISPPANVSAADNATSGLYCVSTLSAIFNPEVLQVLEDARPILVEVAEQISVNMVYGRNGLDFHLRERLPLVTNFMDIEWQHNGPSNPASAAIGPQGYDSHLYYSFGGVADANEDAYLESVCNIKAIPDDAAQGNTPLWVGEWSLATQFKATDEFLFKWADAQKYSYSKGAGWIYWNFKVENSTLAGDLGRQWSYIEALRRGFFTQDPSDFNNASICVPYISA